MVLSPHPDDETLGAGALIARYRALGRPVHVILATRGDHSIVKNCPNENDVRVMRTSEAIKAAKILGVPQSHVHFLAYADGSLLSSVPEIKEPLLRQIAACSPALIVSPCPEKCHDDHKALSMALRELAVEGKVTSLILEYPIWFLPHKTILCFFKMLLSGRQRKILALPYLKQKHRALVAYRSQFYMQPSERMRLLFKMIVKLPSLSRHELFFAFDKEKPQPPC